MSWHPYDRKRRVWTIYWGERAPVSTEPTDSSSSMVEFEMTEPYALHRDKWNNLQIDVIMRLVPPDYTLNISQLWTRLWPTDGALIFTKLHDVYKLPVVLSGQPDTAEQPGKRKDFFWVMAQTRPDPDRLNDIIHYQGVDLENMTWITEQPIEPWPSQLFEYNRAAFAWNRKLLKGSDFDKIVRRECWGILTTHLGSLDFMTTRERRQPDEIRVILQEEAAKYDLELEIIAFDQRPRKPSLVKSLASLPGNLVHDTWTGLKSRNRHP